MENRDIATVEETWKMRAAVYQAASENPSYRVNPPRLEEMDSLDSIEFVVALERLCNVAISEEEVCKILDNSNNIDIKGMGRITDYILGKKCGKGNERRS